MIHMEVPIDKGKFFGTKMTKKKKKKKKGLGCAAIGGCARALKLVLERSTTLKRISQFF